METAPEPAAEFYQLGEAFLDYVYDGSVSLAIFDCASRLFHYSRHTMLLVAHRSVAAGFSSNLELRHPLVDTSSDSTGLSHTAPLEAYFRAQGRGD